MVDPNRSKLYAGIANGLKINLSKSTNVLYLGASHGYTVGFLSSQVNEVFAVEKSASVVQDLLKICEGKKNIIPILEDAYYPERYMNRITYVNVVFQDIAQRDQDLIFVRNMKLLQKGVGILCLKIKSVSSSLSNDEIVSGVRKKLEKEFKIIDESTLEPYEKDHWMFVVEK